MEQEDSDTEDHQQLAPDSDSLQESVISAEQQGDDSGADQVSLSFESIEEYVDYYDQQHEESHDEPDWESNDTQDNHKTLPSTSSKATYPMKSKRNVSRVRLIVADDEEGIIREEGKGICGLCKFCLCAQLA